MLRILAWIWVAMISTNATASRLEELKGSDSGHAVVLLGGIGNSYGYFDPWMSELQQAPASVHGLVHDHRAFSMTQGARGLARGLLELSHRGVRHVTILAHSMGGLVAKKALHLLSHEELARFESIELRTYGTPWGGYFIANFARWIPGSHLVAQWLGYPMATEIGSRSAFMRGLREPLPGHVRWVAYESLDDPVAGPKGASATEQYRSVLTRATAVHRLSRGGHDGFVEVLAFSL